MISDGEGWNYFAVKNLSAFLREITPKINGGFYCLNCLHSFWTNKLESHECNSHVNVIHIMYLIEDKCQQKFDENIKERFLTTYKPSSHDNNNFLLS